MQDLEHYYTLPQIVMLLGEHYNRVYYAVCRKEVVKPKCVGKARLFTAEDVAALRDHFRQRPATLRPIRFRYLFRGA